MRFSFSGMLCSVDWQLVTDVSVYSIGPTLQENLRCATPQKSQHFIVTVV